MTDHHLVFVGGAIRTGTGVLQSGLCSSPDAHPMTVECQYLTAQLRIYRDSLSVFDTFLKDYFETVDGFQAFTRHVIIEFLKITRSNLGANHALVLKNPELTQFIPELAALTPEARFVVSLREPKDAIASMLTVAERQRDASQNNDMVSWGRNVAKFCNHFKAYYAVLVGATRQPGSDLAACLLYVRYEDLLRRTDEMVRRLGAFTGLDLEQFDPEARWNSRKDFDVVERDPTLSAWRTGLSGKGISVASIGRWRDILTDDEAQEIDRRCADFNKLFGYPLD